MRVVFDFFSGIANGLRGSDSGGSYTITQPVKVRPQRRIRSSTQEAIGRFFALLLAVGIGALALSASGSTPRKPPVDSGSQPPLTAIAPALTAEIIAPDPGAAPREWKYIVIHHSGTQRGSAQSFDQYHRYQRKWTGGLGYHFVVGNGTDQGDGVIVAGPRWKTQEPGAHANSSDYNEHGIGICLVGNFDEQPPTLAQLAATRALILKLCADYNIPTNQVVGHNAIRRGGSTACPGKYLSIQQLREGLE
ncbi:MAG TPA: peptidoglycan recognition family protein [Planctomycetota bacterium]|nr:peptidoglycan recognition family protein [Planctomycetota bacterium]